jgi:hypothetical protein
MVNIKNSLIGSHHQEKNTLPYRKYFITARGIATDLPTICDIHCWLIVLSQKPDMKEMIHETPLESEQTLFFKKILYRWQLTAIVPSTEV